MRSELAGLATVARGQPKGSNVHEFFFSSRRRHTRFDCDWSSDVCSSDLRWNSKADFILLSVLSIVLSVAAHPSIKGLKALYPVRVFRITIGTEAKCFLIFF